MDVQAVLEMANQVSDALVAIIQYQFINTQAFLKVTAAFFMRGATVAFSNQEDMIFNTRAHRHSCNLGLVIHAMMKDLRNRQQELAACEPFVPLSPQTAHLGPEFHRLIQRIQGQLLSFEHLIRLMDKLNAIRFFRRFEFHINTMFKDDPNSAQWGIHAAYNVIESPGRIVQGYDQDKFELFAQVPTMLMAIGNEMLDDLIEFDKLASALHDDPWAEFILMEAYEQFKVDFCQVYNLPADGNLEDGFEVDYDHLVDEFDQCLLDCEDWAIALEDKYARLGQEWDEVPQPPQQDEEDEEEPGWLDQVD